MPTQAQEKVCSQQDAIPTGRCAAHMLSQTQDGRRKTHLTPQPQPPPPQLQLRRVTGRPGSRDLSVSTRQEWLKSQIDP